MGKAVLYETPIEFSSIDLSAKMLICNIATPLIKTLIRFARIPKLNPNIRTFFKLPDQHVVMRGSEILNEVYCLHAPIGSTSAVRIRHPKSAMNCWHPTGREQKDKGVIKNYGCSAGRRKKHHCECKNNWSTQQLIFDMLTCYTIATFLNNY